MDRKGKGKQIDGADSSTGGGKKRKGVEFRDEGLRTTKRKTPGVLQFFEESAEVGYYGGSSDEEEDDDGLGFLNDMEEDEPVMEETGNGDQGSKSNSSYVFPKEEEINEDEFDRIMEERYKPGSGFVRFAGDDVKDSIEMDALVPTAKDPPIWKVKCTIGRERHSVLCLMHKFVELRKIGTKLEIFSVFSVEHVKGYIFIEAEKEHGILEACKGLTGIYATRMVLLPKAEAPNLLSVERKSKKITHGKWALVKSGRYKGDLAQVVAVSDSRRKALIKLIPRIDVQALAQKYGGGVSVQKGLTPAPRLISSSELEEFRPLIQVRRDRDTGLTFEHLDSLMLKDGYLYKKVSLDSLTSWGVMPSKEEIFKFTPVERKETGDEEWISEIYGEEKKKKIRPTGKGGGKGEASGGGKEDGSSGSKSESSYEFYNLVCFSRKDFGLIVGVDDKGDGYKVLKEGPDGPAVVTVGKKEMQSGPFNSKFTALDVNNRQISVNDVVKISKGPSEGKQGVVRQIYRGVLFLYDESEEENGGYFCCKSQSCEKVKLFTEDTSEKTDGFDATAFGDSASSPKSPLSPEKEWQPRKKYINSNEGDNGSMYSIGQKLRIRVGPLKGYLCRVIALRYSDVTVKLDSQHKVFTVKSEHLAEVRDRNIALNASGDAGTGSFQPFDMLGTEGSSGDWAKGAGTSGDGGSWNAGAGGASTDWNSWGSKPTSDASQQAVRDDNNTSTWGNETAGDKPASDGDQPGGWNSWNKKPASEAVTVGSWGDAGASKVEASSWGKQGTSTSNVEDSASWGKHGGSSDGNKQEDSRWGKLVEDSESSQKKEENSWGKKGESESGWGNKDGNSGASNKEGGSAWGQKNDGNTNKDDGGSAWGQKNDGNSNKDDGGSAWGQKNDGNSNKDDGGSAWGQKNDGNSNKDDGGSAWGKPGGGSSWGKPDTGGGGSSWGKQDSGGGGSSWGKPKVSEDSSPWSKPGGGSSWSRQDSDGGGGYGGGGRGGGGRGGGGACFKCGESGHMARDCSQGGGGGGRGGGGGGACYKCGEDGHMARDCSQSGGGRGGGGGGACFKCGEAGHMARDCSQGGGGRGGGSGGACYKCGEDGHMARDCSQSGGGRGGGGGGGACFKCGESGHMARDCSQGGGGGGSGGSGWGKQDTSGGVSSWGKQETGGGGSSWGKQDTSGGGSSWGKKDTVEGGSSWGKKDTGGGDSSWGKKDTSGDGSSWGEKSTGGDGSSWGEKSTGGDGSSWGKQDTGGDGSSWGKQDTGGDGSSRGKPDTGGDGSSWSKPDTGGGGSSWSKPDSDGGGSSWGKPRVSEDSSTPWGKPGGGSSWSKQDGDGGGSYGGGGRGSSYGGRGGGGGGACYKCGESGHMARECPQSGGGRGGGGGGACYKCGESGHMARDCSQGGGGGRGGGGGGACFKCGESGHMARECPQGGGGGGGRFGSGGGGSCYKCGESGHFARECTSSGGR